MQQSKEHHKVFFPNLNGLRFFSFLAVFFSHSVKGVFTNTFVLFDYDMFLAHLGKIGVSFFFVLSGFLITYLLLKEQQYTNKINVWAFYIRRALRIWPLYYFVVIFGFLIYPTFQAYIGHPIHMIANPWLCSTFLNNFDIIIHGLAKGQPTIAVLWSIAIEEQFYLVWPLLFVVFPSSTYKYFFGVIIIISFLFRYFYPETANTNTIGVISDMAFGGLGAYLSLKSRRFITFLENMPRYAIIAIYALLAVVVIFNYPISLLPGIAPYMRIIQATVFLMVILDQNYCTHSIFKVSKFKQVSSWGKITYGLYCLHEIGYTISSLFFLRYKSRMPLGLFDIISTSTAFVFSIILATLSYKYFESYFIKLKDRFAIITQS